MKFYLAYGKCIKVPNYIKIDVDGIEHLILEGADQYLSHKNLISISVEINENFKDQYETTHKIMKTFGALLVFIQIMFLKIYLMTNLILLLNSSKKTLINLKLLD